VHVLGKAYVDLHGCDEVLVARDLEEEGVQELEAV
jgi:hypothetical protein